MSADELNNKRNSLIYLVTRFSSRVGAVVLVGMMLLMAGDVFLRFIFNKPVPGAFELIEIMMGAVVSLSIAYCGLRRGHVSVELITDKLPDRIRAPVDLVHHLVCIVFFATIAYKGSQQAIVIKENETVSTLLEVPIYPFVWLLVFGAMLLALVYFRQMIDHYFFKRGSK